MAMSDFLASLQKHWWCRMDDRGDYIPLEGVNQLNAVGEAPIHIAAWKGSANDVQWLLDNGADVHQRGDFGMTPLHYAYMGAKKENIAVLLEAGADPLAQCDHGLARADGRPEVQ